MKLAEFIGELRETVLPNFSDSLEFVSHITGIPYRELSLHMSDEITVSDTTEKLIERLRQSEPLAYVINNKNFYGLDIYTDQRVLIPRPETEVLAEEAVRLAKEHGYSTLLDICTGSGCIPCAVLSECPEMRADIMDISRDALYAAETNMSRYACGRFTLVLADALTYSFPKRYDLVTCNPPYLSEDEWETSDKSLKFEPKNALSAGDDAVVFYKKLIDMIPYLCNKNGAALFELGAGQADIIRGLFPDGKFRFIRDYQNIERVLVWINS